MGFPWSMGLFRGANRPSINGGCHTASLEATQSLGRGGRFCSPSGHSQGAANFGENHVIYRGYYRWVIQKAYGVDF